MYFLSIKLKNSIKNHKLFEVASGDTNPSFSPTSSSYTQKSAPRQKWRWKRLRSKPSAAKNQELKAVKKRDLGVAMSSIGNFAIFSLQDVMGLGSEAKMNTPGVAECNWSWRYNPQALSQNLGKRLNHLTCVYDRVPSK